MLSWNTLGHSDPGQPGPNLIWRAAVALAIRRKVERLFSATAAGHRTVCPGAQGVNIDWDKLYLAYDWAKEWPNSACRPAGVFCGSVLLGDHQSGKNGRRPRGWPGRSRICGWSLVRHPLLPFQAAQSSELISTLEQCAA